MPADRVIALVHDKADGISTGFRQAQPVPIPRAAGVFSRRLIAFCYNFLARGLNGASGIHNSTENSSASWLPR